MEQGINSLLSNPIGVQEGIMEPPIGENASRTEPSSPNIAAIQRHMQGQQSIFSQQLIDFHRLIHVQKVLTGVDPLTGQQLSSLPESIGTNEVPVNTLLNQQEPINNSPTLKKKEVLQKGMNPKTKESKGKTTLETKLKQWVDEDGGIGSVDIVVKIFKIMFKEKTPEGQTLLLNTLLKTTNSHLLSKFVEMDGLKILNSWLEKIQTEENVDLLILTLKVLEYIPVTVEALRTVSIGKIVHKLSKKHPNKLVQDSASKLVKSWTLLLHSVAEQALREEEDTKKVAANKLVSAAALKKKPPSSGRQSPLTTQPTQKSATTASKEDKPSTKKHVLSSTDDFDSMLSEAPTPAKKPKLAPDHIKVKRHTVQMLEVPEVKVSKASSAHNSKPISADAIRSEKNKQKMLNKPSEKTEEQPLKPTPSPVEPAPMQIVNESSMQAVSNESAWEVPKNQFMDDPNNWNPLESERGISKKTGKPKKSVSWSTSLENIRTFQTQTQTQQLDVDFALARQQEHKSEREILASKKRKDEEEWLHKQSQIQPTIFWRNPPLLVLPTKRNEVNSMAYTTENEREKAVLMVYYFEGEQIPETPTEIDNSSTSVVEYDDSQVKPIPFQEIGETIPVQTMASPIINQDILGGVNPQDILNAIASLQRTGIAVVSTPPPNHMRQPNVVGNPPFPNSMDQYPPPSFGTTRTNVTPYQMPPNPLHQPPPMSYQSNNPPFYQNKMGPPFPNSEHFNANRPNTDNMSYSKQDGRFGGFEQQSLPPPSSSSMRLPYSSSSSSSSLLSSQQPQQQGNFYSNNIQDSLLMRDRKCVYFPIGQCKNGDNCPFIHDYQGQTKSRRNRGGKH